MKKIIGLLLITFLYSCQAEDPRPLPSNDNDAMGCNPPKNTECDMSQPLSAPKDHELDTIGDMTANSNSNEPIRQFQFTDESIGFAITRPASGSQKNEFFKTTDGGDTWELIDIPEAQRDYIDMHFENENSGAIILENSKELVITQNGGLDWEHIDINEAKGKAVDVGFDEMGDLYVGFNDNDHRFIIVKSSNHGEDWEEFFTYDKPMLMQVKAKNIYLHNSTELVQLSLEGDIINTAAPVNTFNKIQIINKDEWVYQDKPFGLYSTTDAGKNWTMITDSEAEIIGFEKVDKGLYIDIVGHCPDPNQNEDAENCVIVHYDGKKDKCSHSLPAFHTRRRVQWVQQIEKDKWYITTGKYLLEMKKD